MRVRLLCLCLGLLACLSAVGAQDDNSISKPTQHTVVPLVQGVENSVQLALHINGDFTYPFVFSVDPQPTNHIEISGSGQISGTPSAGPDQELTVTIEDNNGKTVATYPLLLHITDPTKPLTVVLGSGAPLPPPSTADEARPESTTSILVNPVYQGGDTVSGQVLPAVAAVSADNPQTQPSAKSQNASSGAPVTPAQPSAANGQKATANPAVVTIKCKPGENANTGCDSNLRAQVLSDKDGSFSYQFHAPLYAGDQVTVSSGSAQQGQTVSVQIPPNLFGEEMRAIVGYQQAGASSSDFQQNWFLDFYISRPLAFLRRTEGTQPPWFRWWGNVRVASFPQQGNQSLSDIVTGLPTQIGALKLNQMAEGAEFLSGIELEPWRSFPFRGFSENSRQIFSLGIIAGFGATGYFSSPSNNVQVFQVPASGSPQYTTFHNLYPNVATANVGFISPNLERFPKQYLAGLRLTTHYVDPSGMPLTTSPAMLAFTVGQNQVITGGRLSGIVGRVEAFYPLPFGNRKHGPASTFSSVYLFGDAQMRLGGSQSVPPLVLDPVSTPASDPSVTLVSLPNTRDEYRIGFGVDLVNLISSLTGGSAKKATAASLPAPGSDTAVAKK